MANMTTEELQVFAEKVFASQPFSQFLGAELTDAGAGTAELTLPMRDELTQQHGFAHGGVVSYLADNAITFAGGLALGSNALTSEFKVNYVKPGVGDTLVARAEAKGVGRRQAVCRCEIFAVTDEAETLCALAQGTVIPAKDPDPDASVSSR